MVNGAMISKKTGASHSASAHLRRNSPGSYPKLRNGSSEMLRFAPTYSTQIGGEDVLSTNAQVATRRDRPASVRFAPVSPRGPQRYRKKEVDRSPPQKLAFYGNAHQYCGASELQNM